MCIANGRIAGFGQQGVMAPRPACCNPSQTRQLEAGEHLFFEADRRTHVFVVESGWVKLYRTLVDGQRQVVGFANTGSILGLESDFEHSNGCQAITPATVRSISIEKITEMCTSDGALAQKLLGQLGRQLAAAQAQLATVGAQSAEQKLASFLMSMSDLCGAADGDVFRLPMRRGEMGEFLGLRLETVSRQMSEFQRCGWIRMTSLYDCQLIRRDVIEELAQGGVADHGPLRLAS
jgi:CRP/FNR family transcriptional regulator